jgi:hypothetical protein
VEEVEEVEEWKSKFEVERANSPTVLRVATGAPGLLVAARRRVRLVALCTYFPLSTFYFLLGKVSGKPC